MRESAYEQQAHYSIEGTRDRYCKQKCIAIYCNAEGRIAIRIPIYWYSVKSKKH